MAPITDWDINDSVVPKISAHELNVFSDWPDGHCRRVYAATNEDVKKHTSGWAMRNTNNHNVNILKKSCLGVIVCSKSCVSVHGTRIQIRPAICDKARKKQRDKPCPNSECDGNLIIKACRGHCGYPVTHFWRTNGDEVYFQAKGTHDHPRPEPKGSHQTKQLYAVKRKSSAAVGLDALKRKTAITTKLRALRVPGPLGRAAAVKGAAMLSAQKPQLACANTASGAAHNDNLAWSATPYSSTSNQYQSFTYANQQQQPHGLQQLQSHQQQPQNRVPWTDYDYNAASNYPNHSVSNDNKSPPQMFATEQHQTPSAVDFLRPEDIFQLDQPIVDVQQHHHHQPQHQQQQYNNQFGYAVSTYSNGMSPSSSSSSSSSSASQSPPCTFLDLESGRIQHTNFHPNMSSNQLPYQQVHHQQQQQQLPTNIKYEPHTVHSGMHSDDTASISNEFDETYMNFQQHVQQGEFGVFFGANSSDFPQATFSQHQQQTSSGDQQQIQHQYDIGYNHATPSDLDLMNSADEWMHMDMDSFGGRQMQTQQHGVMGF